MKKSNKQLQKSCKYHFMVISIVYTEHFVHYITTVINKNLENAVQFICWITCPILHQSTLTTHSFFISGQARK